MERSVTAFIVAFVINNLPALAQTSTAIDDHLRIEVSDQLSLSTSGYLGQGFAFWGSSVARGPSWSIFKGRLPISDERFVELIDQSNAAPEFDTLVEERHSRRLLWGTSFWIGFAATSFVGSFGPVFIRTSSSQDFYNVAFLTLGSLVAALTVSTVSAVQWANAIPRENASTGRPFSVEEADNAIEKYNNWLDAKKSNSSDARD